jgi:TRAP-type C4-dicarboxylate transport system permease small subunit
MRLIVRTLVLLVVFVGVGWLTGRTVAHHAAAGTPVAEVRLSAAMAALFAGGAAAVVVGIALVWRRQA